MHTDDFLRLARKHVDANPDHESSARLCLADAIECWNNGDWHHARERALRSLSYSIGVLAPDYQKAAIAHVSLDKRTAGVLTLKDDAA